MELGNDPDPSSSWTMIRTSTFPQKYPYPRKPFVRELFASKHAAEPKQPKILGLKFREVSFKGLWVVLGLWLQKMLFSQTNVTPGPGRGPAPSPGLDPHQHFVLDQVHVLDLVQDMADRQ